MAVSLPEVCRLWQELPKMGVVGAASSRMVAWTPVATSQKRVQHSRNDIKLEEGVREGVGHVSPDSGPSSSGLDS